MDVVYRSLSDADMIQLKKGGSLISKITLDPNQLFKEALQQINTHIAYGSTKPTCWISSTTSLQVAVAIYNLSTMVYPKKRNPVAVIRTHSQNEILDGFSNNLFSKDLNWIQKRYQRIGAFSMEEIKKANYRFETRELIKKIGNSGLILKKDGTPCKNNVLAYGYALKSEEVITLHQIPKEDIVGLLSPSQMDFLYSIPKNAPEFAFYLDQFLGGVRPKKPTLPVLQRLQEDLYDNGKSLVDLTSELWQQSQGDLFDIYGTMVDLRRELFYATYPGRPFISVPEQERRIVRLGNKVEEKKQISYHGFTLNTVMPVNSDVHDSKLDPLTQIGFVGCTNPDWWKEDQIWSCNGDRYRQEQLFGNSREKIKQYIKYK